MRVVMYFGGGGDIGRGSGLEEEEEKSGGGRGGGGRHEAAVRAEEEEEEEAAAADPAAESSGGGGGGSDEWNRSAAAAAAVLGTGGSSRPAVAATSSLPRRSPALRYFGRSSCRSGSANAVAPYRALSMQNELPPSPASKNKSREGSSSRSSAAAAAEAASTTTTTASSCCSDDGSDGAPKCSHGSSGSGSSSIPRLGRAVARYESFGVYLPSKNLDLSRLGLTWIDDGPVLSELLRGGNGSDKGRRIGKSLRRLSLSHNAGLGRVPSPVLALMAGHLPSLRHLDLSGCGLTPRIAVPPTPQSDKGGGSGWDLPELVHLDLSDNGLVEFPGKDILSGLPKLKVLNLSKNHLLEIRIPYNVRSLLPNLSKLDLSCNDIFFLPPELAELESLKVLNLVNNYLTEVPETICCDMNNLTAIDVAFNPVARPPAETCRRGVAAMRRYWRRQRQQQQQQQQRKSDEMAVGGGRREKRAFPRTCVAAAASSPRTVTELPARRTAGDWRAAAQGCRS